MAKAANDDPWAGIALAVQKGILNANLIAQKIPQHRDRNDWLEIGRGRLEIRAEALRLAGDGINNQYHPRYRHFHALLMTKAPDLKALEEHDHTSCQHAVWMCEQWEELESWLATLPLAENTRLNHPSVIKRRFDAAHKRKPQGLEKPPTRVARMMARIQQLEDEVRDLKQQLREAK